MLRDVEKRRSVGTKLKRDKSYLLTISFLTLFSCFFDFVFLRAFLAFFCLGFF